VKKDCPLPPGSTVWGYFRDSGGDNQEQSVRQQRDAAQTYCTTHHLVLATTFADEARQGSSMVSRDALHDLLSQARNLAPDRNRRQSEAPDGILFWDTRRLGRDQLDNAFIKADLRRRDYTLVFLSDDIPDVGDFTPVIESFLDWKAEQDLKEIGKDARRGLHDLVSKRGPDGRYLGLCPGCPPTGFKGEEYHLDERRDGKPHIVQRWVPDPEVWPRAKKAWEMRAAGASYETILAETRLFKTKGGFTTFFVNEIYRGTLVFGDERYEDFVPVLVDQETWDAVQSRRFKRPKRGGKHPVKNAKQQGSPYLLSGVAECGYCGAAMVGGKDNVNTRPNPWVYYLCGRKRREGWDSCEGRKIDAEVIHQTVLEYVLTEVLTEPVLRRMQEQINQALVEEMPNLEEDLMAARAELRRLDQAIERLLDAIEAGDSRRARQRLEERETERDLIAARIAALEVRQNQGQIRIDDAALKALIEEMRDDLLSEDVAVARSILKQLVVKLKVKNDGGTLTWTFPRVTGFWSVPPREFESLSPP
jgi:DNA invertase Pin-like site-specific DNA recombinase